MRVTLPRYCSQCEKHYYHANEIKQIRGGTMCSYNNHYCTGLRKHKKLTMTSAYKKIPDFCPLIQEVEQNRLLLQNKIDEMSRADSKFLGVTGEAVLMDEQIISEFPLKLRHYGDMDKAVEATLRSYIRRYYS